MWFYMCNNKSDGYPIPDRYGYGYEFLPVASLLTDE
jgi:hypothetical protein